MKFLLIMPNFFSQITPYNVHANYSSMSEIKEDGKFENPVNMSRLEPKV